MPFQFRKEAIEEDLNSNFPSQGQGNPPLYYSLSEVVVPTYSINNAAEGTSLPEQLQEAWDFSIGSASFGGATNVLINNTGFWRLNYSMYAEPGNEVKISISDGLTSKDIVRLNTPSAGTSSVLRAQGELIVFIRSGDSVSGLADPVANLSASWRQIATVNGDLVNPLGFSFA